MTGTASPRTLPPLPAGFVPEAEFPILKQYLFFNHAGVSPLSARAATAMREYAEESMNQSYLSGTRWKRIEAIRGTAAKMINADVEEIAFIKNTSEGIAFVANGLEWQPGDEVVSAAIEYPANVYPWMDLAQRKGIRHLMVPEREGRVRVEDLLNAVTPRTKVMALSHVEYASGYRNDLATIGRFCRDRGILFCVDAIQSIGALPVDVKAMHVDFMAACGHKWMVGPEGLGIFYCRKEIIPRVHPEVGSLNVVNHMDFSHFDLTLKNDARRFECGTHNIPGIFGLGASLNLFLEVGMDLVWARIRGLTDLLVEGVQAKGYSVFSPRGEAEASGIVSFYSKTIPHGKIVKELEGKKIIVIERGERLRASPHFYQDAAHIEALVAALPAH
jgi:selenocysteine lyase/cysteine desulfurase